MKHDILGEVEQSDGGPFDAAATISYGLRNIKFGISRDGQPLDAVLKFAAEVASRLGELDELAKHVASRDLRDCYNDNWSEYDEVQDDGSFKTVLNPKLSAVEFEAKLTLSAVNVTGDGMIEFFYDDQRMFGSHSVIVNSLNGIDLSEARAEIFG